MIDVIIFPIDEIIRDKITTEPLAISNSPQRYLRVLIIFNYSFHDF